MNASAIIANENDKCAYCGVRAVAVTPGDFLVCIGHSDHRTDRYIPNALRAVLTDPNRPIAGQRHAACGRMVGFGFGEVVLHVC